MGTNVLEIFEKEVHGLIRKIVDVCLKLDKDFENAAHLQELMRCFHTLKGSARAVQFLSVLRVAHDMEGIYHDLLDTGKAPTSDLVDLSLYATDIIGTLVRSGNSDKESAPEDFFELVNAYNEGNPLNIPRPSHHSNGASDNASEGESGGEGSPTAPVLDADMVEAPIYAPQQANSQILDKLLGLAGELTVAVSAIQNQRRNFQQFSSELINTTREIGSNIRLGAQDNQLEGGQTGQESLLGLNKIYTKNLEELEHFEARLMNLSSSLSNQVTEARLVAVDSILTGLPRVVRDLAKELNKECRIEVSGDSTRVDSAVVETISVPLLHLVRNALSHGIESPNDRRKAGKSPEGLVKIEVRRLSTEVQLIILDDGNGIDLDAIRDAVIGRGDVSLETWNSLSNDEQLQFIFLPGFSTSKTVTEVSGRGFGLDIVKSEVEQIGGRIEVETNSGIGTRFVVYAPLSLSLLHSLLVVGGKHPYFGRQLYCFPTSEVKQVRRVSLEDIRTVDGQDAVRIDDHTLKLFRFSRVMKLEAIHANIAEQHVLIIGNEKTNYALIVDEVLGDNEIVSRPLAQQLKSIEHVSGSALLLDGGIALIADVKDMVQTLSTAQHLGSQEESVDESATGTEKQGRILIVEDSVTVREVERHVLASAGYDVVTAVDGKDGLNKIKRGHFDVIVSDVDMPRLDGIEMIRQLRSQERYATIPIIVVSYKDRKEDRQKALDVGATYYVTKSEFDSGEMLELIADLIGRG